MDTTTLETVNPMPAVTATITIRPAQPDDSGPIAELMYSSGPDIYDYLFKTRKRSAIDFMRHEFRTGIGFCGYKNVTVAVQNDVVVGTGCFYDRARYERLVKGTGKNIKWVSQVGSKTYGNTVVAHGKVFIGTNNGKG